MFKGLSEVNGGYTEEDALRSVGEGWAPIIKNLYETLEYAYINLLYAVKSAKKYPQYQKTADQLKHWESFRVDQVKEKFGGLRFYYHGGVESFRGAVDFAENMSYRVCEYCGTTKHVVNSSDGIWWVKTLCPKCRLERIGKSWDRIMLNGQPPNTTIPRFF